MKRIIAVLIIVFFLPAEMFSQQTSWDIRFDGKDAKELYRRYDVTSENNIHVLDFSRLARKRKPLTFELDKKEAPKASFSAFVWVKAPKGVEQSSVILTNKKSIDGDGWEIKASENGSWSWTFKHESNIIAEYNATFKRQSINDGEFHLIGISYDYTKNQVWLYFDGENVGIVNVGKGDLSNFKNLTIGGVGEKEKYSFNGYFKAIFLFKDHIHNGRVVKLYRNNSIYSGNIGVNGTFYKTVKFLTWNISDGGMSHGTLIGLNRTLEVIKESKADIIALQETNGSGEYLADELGYYFYSISRELSILSKFPIKRTVKLYKAEMSGGVEIVISKDQYIYFFNVKLDETPNWNSLEKAYADASFRAEEKKNRGVDLNEMLEQIQVLLRPNGNTSIIFSGELNSLSNLDNGGDVTKYPVTSLMFKYSYKDSYMSLHSDGEKKPGDTCCVDLAAEKRGRVDYIYYKGSEISVQEAKVINHHPIRFPSKHYGVLTELKWKK